MTSKRGKAHAAATRAWIGPWLIHFFQRHVDDDSARRVPGREFLDACPTAVAAKLVAILKAVADAPPPAFSGGGKWEAMHGDASKPFRTTLSAAEYGKVRALGRELLKRAPRSVAK